MSIRRQTNFSGNPPAFRLNVVMRELCSLVTGLPVLLLDGRCLRAILSLAVWLSLATDAHAAGELVSAPHGMVVSSHRRASEVGMEVLRKGGNAVDASIATGLALAAVASSALRRMWPTRANGCCRA